MTQVVDAVRVMAKAIVATGRERRIKLATQPGAAIAAGISPTASPSFSRQPQVSPQTTPPPLAGAQAAKAQLLAMARPKPAVAVAGAGGPQPGPPGANQPPAAAGQPMATLPGRNTPTTNPIGLLSGLGKDPGGASAMGNAALGTQNNVIKTAVGILRAAEKRAISLSPTALSGSVLSRVVGSRTPTAKLAPTPEPIQAMLQRIGRPSVRAFAARTPGSPRLSLAGPTNILGD